LPRSNGPRARSRSLLRKKLKQRGLRPLGYLLIEYKTGDQVTIIIDPAMHSGMPFKRFQGSRGEIIEKRGRAYVVKVMEGGKAKSVIARPEHIQPVSE
jgi:large subunit ribosomal protein L21e